ncbi:MAG TPA: MFS transporter [Ktedonobacterales bacterium]|nr:MFS transporter [Ktedonobacterales bacterium]
MTERRSPAQNSDEQAHLAGPPQASSPLMHDAPGSAGTAASPPVPPSVSDASARPARANGETAGKWTVLAIVAVGVFMSTLDSSIVNISLPAIAHYFGVALGGAVEWVIIAYLVIIAAVLLTIGRLADLLGRKPIWATGLIIFTLGSALCGAAPSLELLVAARAFQGLGAALLFAVSPAMLTTAFPPHERGRALGLNAVVVALGVSAGPTIGGILTDQLTWRAIFYVNVPLGIAGTIATVKFLTERRPHGHARFDPAGALLLAIGLASLTLGLSFGQEWGWTSPALIASLAGAAVALVAMVVVERYAASPIVNFGLLKDRVFASANVSLVLSFLALFAVSFMLPFYLEELRGFSTQDSGFLLTPLPLTIAVIAPFSGTLADRIGTRWLAATGLAVACVGLVLISQLGPSSSLPDIIWPLVITGFGQGLFQSPNNSALMGAAPAGQQGTAAGFLATGRVVGQSVSVALAGAVFASLGGAAAGHRVAMLRAAGAGDAGQIAALQQTFTYGFQATFLVCAVVAAIGVFTSLVRGKEQRVRAAAELH